MKTKPSVGTEVIYKGKHWYVRWVDGSLVYLEAQEGQAHNAEEVTFISEIELA